MELKAYVEKLLKNMLKELEDDHSEVLDKGYNVLKYTIEPLKKLSESIGYTKDNVGKEFSIKPSDEDIIRYIEGSKDVWGVKKVYDEILKEQGIGDRDNLNMVVLSDNLLYLDIKYDTTFTVDIWKKLKKRYDKKYRYNIYANNEGIRVYYGIGTNKEKEDNYGKDLRKDIYLGIIDGHERGLY